MAEQLTWDHFTETVSECLGVEPEELTPQTNIYDELGIDSLGLFSLGMKLIKVYGIKLPLSVVSTIQTVEDLYKDLEKYGNSESEAKA